MVFQVNVEAGLRQLQRVRDQLLALLEWEKLALGEQRRDLPPAFRIQTSTLHVIDQDLRAMHTAFRGLAESLGAILDRHDLVCTTQEREQWKRRLDVLERQVAGCRLTERFLSG